MSKKACYFKCKYDGPLYGFPPLSYTSYEKFRKWKNILRKKDQEKGDHFIISNFKLCKKHFEPFYIVPNKRLTRNAVPTLELGITGEQEELLVSLLEENFNLIMEYNISGEMVDEVIEKWKTIAPQLNALGEEKSYSEWAEYLYDVMSNLKTKRIIWSKANRTNSEMVQNSDDFTDLELKILELWRKREQASSDHFEINVQDENGVEYMIEVGDADDSKDSETGSHWPKDNKSGNEIVTFTLNIATGGHKPLLQAADIAPYEVPQDASSKCKCTHSDGEEQDEFDAFGKDIAQELRSMPKQTALETQQLLVSIIRNKQSKIINDSFLFF